LKSILDEQDRCVLCGYTFPVGQMTMTDDEQWECDDIDAYADRAGHRAPGTSDGLAQGPQRSDVDWEARALEAEATIEALTDGAADELPADSFVYDDAEWLRHLFNQPAEERLQLIAHMRELANYGSGCERNHHERRIDMLTAALARVTAARDHWGAQPGPLAARIAYEFSKALDPATVGQS
jgi:hypothetical protein